MQPTAVYPSVLSQKILAQEAPGDIPHTLNIVIPTVTKPGQPFRVKVAVLDKTGYPSLHCQQAVELQTPQQGSATIAFERGRPAVGSLAGIQLPREGVFRLSARCDGLQAHSNPTLCTSGDVPGIYWGDPHVHTILSNCHVETCRSLNFCFTAARHLSALDWVAAADHVSLGWSPPGVPRCDAAKWKEQRTVAELYNDAPDFVTLPAYEASLAPNAGGDNIVYMSRFAERFVDEFEGGTVKTLCRKLADQLPPDDFFVVPHHTTRAGGHGEMSDDIYPGSQAMPAVEIHSKWGTSEYRGNPNPLQNVHSGPSYVQDLLARGFKLGFIAGTDTHATMPAGGGVEPGHIDRLPGMTAIQSAELTRQSVFNAIRRRHCYGASLERILLHGSVAGHAFGEDGHLASLSTPPKIDVLVAAQSDVVRIELVRNGKTIHSITPRAWKAQLVYEDGDDLGRLTLESPHLNRFIYYYVRATCESGAQAWSSPVWILG